MKIRHINIIVLLVASFLAFVCHPTRALETSVYIGGNQLTYRDLILDHTTDVYQYYATVVRAGQTHRTNIHETEYYVIDQTDSQHWLTRYANYIGPSTPTPSSYWQLQAYSDTAEKSITFTLDDDQLDFAAFGFNQTISRRGTFMYQNLRLPAYTIQVCDAYRVTLGYDNSPRTVLPNPGCDHDHRQIKITLINGYPANNDDTWEVRFYGWSFNIAPQVSDTLISISRRDGAEFAYTADSDIRCQDVSCPVAVFDSIMVSDLVAGEVESVDYWPYAWSGYNYTDTSELQPQLKSLIREKDGSLTASLEIPTFSHPMIAAVTTILGTSDDPEKLWFDWGSVSTVAETSLEDYQGLAYVDQRRTWQVANFPAQDTWDWDNGFYVTVRWQDPWGQYSTASSPYFCVTNSCSPTGLDYSVPAYIREIGFGGPDGQSPIIRVQLTDWEYTWDDLTVFARQDDGVSLSTAAQFNQTATLDWPELTRDGVELYLYDRKTGKVIDKATYGAVAAPYGLVRDSATWEWKVNYVRQ